MGEMAGPLIPLNVNSNSDLSPYQMWTSVKQGIQSATRMRGVKTQTARTHANVALVTMVMGIGVETSMSVKQDLFAPPRQCAKICL